MTISKQLTKEGVLLLKDTLKPSPVHCRLPHVSDIESTSPEVLFKPHRLDGFVGHRAAFVFGEALGRSRPANPVHS